MMQSELREYQSIEAPGHSHEKPWRCKRCLYEAYHAHGLDKEAIGREWDCSGANIGQNMRRRGVSSSRPFDFAYVLEMHYWGQGMTQQEIGDRYGVDQGSIGGRLNEKGIKTKTAGDYHELSVREGAAGYMICRHRDGSDRGEDRNDGRKSFMIHRLVGVALYGFEAVCENVVHHSDRRKLNNSHDNLELMDPSDHVAHHHEQGDILGD